jgi:hypothetical protein
MDKTLSEIRGKMSICFETFRPEIEFHKIDSRMASPAVPQFDRKTGLTRPSGKLLADTYDQRLRG